MKASRYNYSTDYKDGVIFMNGITEASFMVKAEHKQTYQTIINNPDEHYEVFGAFIDRIRALGFIVGDEVDELALLKQKYAALRRSHEYRLMILPTYACNLRCWYCVQEHKDEWLTSEQFDSIAKLVEQKLNSDEIRVFTSLGLVENL